MEKKIDICEKLVELHKAIDELHIASENLAAQAILLKQNAEQAAVFAKQIAG